MKLPLLFLCLSVLSAPAANLLSSAFDGNTGAAVLPGNTDNTSGSATLTVTDWILDPSVTAISGLTAISTDNGTTTGGFARLQGGTAAFANADCVFLARNHNLGAAPKRRGFSLSFTLSAPRNLTSLTVLSGHTANSGNQDQSYSSDLVYSLSGGTLVSPVSGTSLQDYGTGTAYHSVVFDLAGTTLGAGTYSLQVYQTNLSTGGAYATYNGISLEGENNQAPPPVISSFASDRSYVAAGGTVTLSWQTDGADTLVIDQGVGDVTPLSVSGAGSRQVTVNGPVTYTLTATNANGASTRSVAIASGPPRPNLVVFLVDDFGTQDLSVPFCLDPAGNPVAYRFNSFYQTPNMAALAASGVRFTSAYAQSVCSPTRCGLLTGRNSTRHAVTDWVGGGGTGSPVNWRTTGLNTTDVTLPNLLRDGGYRTIHVGKGHFTNGAVSVEALGFDVNIAGFGWGHPHSGYMGVSGYGGMPGLEAYDGSMFLTKALTIEANKALDNAVAEGRPFFLNMSYYATHAPFTTNPDATGNYSAAVSAGHAAFATMVEGVDISIGQIRQKLVDLGVAENTLLVFLGDNGSDSPATTVDGFPSGIYSDFPLRGKKGSKWEGGTRVPLIACWAATNPANPFQQALPIPANRVETDMVTSWDVPVTLLNVAGLPAPAGFGEDGYDLRPYLAGTPGSHRPQEIVVHYPHVHRSNYFSWIRQGNMKLIYNYESNTHQLYDLAADPKESTNLAAAQPVTVTRMARALARHLATSWGSRGALIPTVATTAPNGNVVSIPANPAVDVDGDGLADSTEDPDLNGLIGPGETDPDNENTDGDATPDGAEVRTGTDPLSGASDFGCAFSRDAGGNLVITWPTRPGATYRILTSRDLTDWSVPPLVTVPAAPTGNSTSYLLPGGEDPARFYRVELVP